MEKQMKGWTNEKAEAYREAVKEKHFTATELLQELTPLLSPLPSPRGEGEPLAGDEGQPINPLISHLIGDSFPPRGSREEGNSDANNFEAEPK